jgi:AraC-like DNA-binding protein
VLRPDLARRGFTLERLAPPEALAEWVEHLWVVRWDLPPGTSFPSEVLTHPAVHLTVEQGTEPRFGYDLPAALVHGVVTRTFRIELRGAGSVVGARFRPGGFGAFTGRDVAELTDRVVAMREVLGDRADALVDAVVAAGTDDRRAAGAVTAALEARRPPPDPRYDELLGVVRLMLEDRTLTSVEAVTERVGLSSRTLQRRFRRYVGVGPKWVLQRFRLHDAVALIDAGEVTDLASLAAELGWYDQAHFNRDFADLLGVPPLQYAAGRQRSDSMSES